MPHLKSMTAYAELSYPHTLGRFNLEVQSVNRKHLEVQLYLPQELQRFESDLRRLVQKYISRGQVVLKIFSEYNAEAPIEIRPNLPYAKSLLQAFLAASTELNVPFDPSSFFNIASNSKNLFIEVKSDKFEWEKIFHLLEDAVQRLLQEFAAMKEKEAAALEADITERLHLIEKIVEGIKEKSHDSVEKLKNKLLLKIEEYLSASTEAEERLIREVALFAEKVDITEEITRLSFHLKQFHHLLEKGGAIGKTLDFLLQELNREVNTIGSKAQDANIAHLVVGAKSEIEKIREQIQNLE